MISKSLLLSLFAFSVAFADTPPPGTVKAKMWSGDGNTSFTATGSALDVNVKNSSIPVTGTFWPATQPVSGTFWQSIQPVSGTLTCNAGSGTQAVSLASLPALAAGANTIGNVNINGTVPVSGTITTTNTANADTGSTVPDQATQVAGVDGAGDLRALKVSNLGVLSVDASGSTVPVSGTFWQATQPVSAASLPLPSGAATSAKQPALGTAGTASADVLTVQGIASMTALKVDGSAVTQPVSGTFWQATQPVSGTVAVSNFPATQPVSGTVTANIGTTNGLALDATVSDLQVAQNSTTSGQSGSLAQGAVTTSAPTYTTAKTSPLSLTTAGALRVDASATTQPVSGTVTANAGTGTFAVSAASLPLPSGAATSANQTTANTSLSSIDTKTPSLGQALAASSVPVVLTASQLSTLTPLSSVAATQSGTWNVGLSAGSNVIGHVIVDTAPTTAVTQSGTWTVQPGNTANTTAWLVNAVPKTPAATTVKAAAITIGTSAVRLTNDGSAPPSTRVLLIAQLLSSSTANCFLGPSTVTSSGATRGTQMFAGQSFSFNNDAGDYYAICDASSQTFLITEQE